jgi:hypothetical protein
MLQYIEYTKLIFVIIKETLKNSVPLNTNKKYQWLTSEERASD